MKRHAVVAAITMCCLAVLCVFAAAQDQPAAKFRADVELVELAVSVHDKAGAHVTGLKPEQFTVYENNKAQRVSAVQEILTAPDVLQSGVQTSGTFSNRLTTGQPVPRVTLILLDLLHTNFSDQVHARSQLAKFLLQWESREPVALLTLSCRGLQVAHDFAWDPRLLLVALKRVQPSAANNAKFENTKSDNSTAAGRSYCNGADCLWPIR